MATPQILIPPMPDRLDGVRRRVGVEVEFTGLDAHQAAGLVVELYGGSVERLDEHRNAVRGSRLGDFRIELDMMAAHPDKSGAEQPRGKLDRLEERFRGLVGDVGSLIMPYEIICPPVEIERLEEVDLLVRTLRERGAVGTEGGLLYAFGLHLNPEIPSRDGGPLLDILKAYLLLSPWLRQDIDVDLARRVSPFIQKFADEYVSLVVDPNYRPDLRRWAEDYVRANPSRNRELDLFPLFAELVPDVLKLAPGDPHIRKRPTFHWRLPNSLVGVKDWSIVPDWNRWVQVERLASDRWALDELGALWRDCQRCRALEDWPQLVARWLPPT
ncbi:MAG TPA: amidoligase family protein [Azospirillaceae bacterium]|nr:amidoligase family protein [Azospirillaceae bacterium]